MSDFLVHLLGCFSELGLLFVVLLLPWSATVVSVIVVIVLLVLLRLSSILIELVVAIVPVSVVVSVVIVVVVSIVVIVLVRFLGLNFLGNNSFNDKWVCTMLEIVLCIGDLEVHYLLEELD